MRSERYWWLPVLLLLPFATAPGCRAPAVARDCPAPSDARPDDRLGDEEALRRVIAARRSIRTYTDEPLTAEDVRAVLWASQGVTLSPEEADRVDGQGLRASPSAGATFPLETYLLSVRVDGLEPGLYHYRPETDGLEPAGPPGDLIGPVAEACNGQRVVATAAALVVYTAVLARTAQRYGDRAERYVMMELGHVNQNAHLMATARGLGACAIGAFEDGRLAQRLGLPADHVPYYMLALGRPVGQTVQR